MAYYFLIVDCLLNEETEFGDRLRSRSKLLMSGKLTCNDFRDILRTTETYCVPRESTVWVVSLWKKSCCCDSLENWK